MSERGGDDGQERSLRQRLLEEIDYENPELTEPGSEFVARSDPDRPPHPGGNLVQCRNCGMYWDANNPREECDSCGTEPDIFWNLVTYRTNDHPEYDSPGELVPDDLDFDKE